MVVRELVLGPKRFTDLRHGLPGIATNVLSQRLRELEREHGTLTLLCHERIPPSEYCHRLALVELLATT
jgi:DNA-binding HxlR family transcriptional regulator